jgi:hypothetical protein
MPNTEETTLSLGEKLEACRINPQDDVKLPPAAILINSEGGQIPSFTLGNFSMVIGKAKSKRTFLVGVLAAAAITGDEIINTVQGTLPDNKRKVLYFDTEQGKYHATRSIKRIADLAGIENPDNLIAYGLRKYDPDVRLELIETGIYQESDVGLVIIDGGRDLLSVGINDEKSATNVTTKFLLWTEEREIHIVVVLHQNKNDLNARGHFGTECVNKAETTASVTECLHERSISVVHCEYCRDIQFADFAFRINSDGLPEACDVPSGNAAQQRSSMRPDDVEDSFHREIIRQIFEDNDQMIYGDFWKSIKQIVTQKRSYIGVNRAKDYVTYYVDHGWVKKEERKYTLGP